MDTVFSLQIDLGSDAMSNGGDIASALRKVADRLDDYGNLDVDAMSKIPLLVEVLEKKDLIKKDINDVNGNTVGSFRLGPREPNVNSVFDDFPELWGIVKKFNEATVPFPFKMPEGFPANEWIIKVLAWQRQHRGGK